MKVTFMGSPDFSVPVLATLIDAGHDIAAVYCQPPRSAGRGKQSRPTPVHQFAENRDLDVVTPSSLRDSVVQQVFAGHGADVAVVVAYGLILPPEVLDAPTHGCLNLHASLLPRWRGAAPIQRAIMAGDSETGVTVMRMDQGLDTGPVCLSQPVPIGSGTTAGELHGRLAEAGAPLMCRALEDLQAGKLSCTAQPDDGVTHAAKIDKAEAAIDFSRTARDVLNQVHGLSPFPGAYFMVRSGMAAFRIKLLKCEAVDGAGTPGEVLDGDLAIACGRGAIRPVLVQREGKAAMERAAFLRGVTIASGTILTSG